nr:hypothetical protein [Tanacetum cinerariifolium]
MVVAAAMKMVRRLRWWGGGGNGVKAVVVVARDGEWHGGSNRSGDGESFWVRRKSFPTAAAGGRLWWPVVGERDGRGRDADSHEMCGDEDGVEMVTVEMTWCGGVSCLDGRRWPEMGERRLKLKKGGGCVL